MRLPRDLSGEELAALLGSYGYEVTRQTGSHMRLTTTNAILRDVAEHLDIPRQMLLTTLFGK